MLLNNKQYDIVDTNVANCTAIHSALPIAYFIFGPLNRNDKTKYPAVLSQWPVRQARR
jgi:hypothetical protein